MLPKFACIKIRNRVSNISVIQSLYSNIAKFKFIFLLRKKLWLSQYFFLLYLLLLCGRIKENDGR